MIEQEVIDLGYERYIDELKDSYVDIGILTEPGAKKHPDKDGKQTDITLAELAAIQEYGTSIQVTPKMRKYLAVNGLVLSKNTEEITIPSRPYMRQTFDEEQKGLERLIDEKETEILEGLETRRRALDQIGQTHRQQIQKAMRTQGKFKENHPFTAERKGSSQPLIDDGILRQAIDYMVHDGD